MPPGKSISLTGILLMLAGSSLLLGWLLFLMYRAGEMLAQAPQPGW